MGRRFVLITAALVAVASPITVALVNQGSGTSDNRSGLSAIADVQRRYPSVPAQPKATAALLLSLIHI